MTTQTKLTPTQAQSFNRYSATNASTVQSRLSCGCEPYKDVFTYNRWQALGYQVQRGEQSITIPANNKIAEAIAISANFRAHLYNLRQDQKYLREHKLNDTIRPYAISWAKEHSIKAFEAMAANFPDYKNHPDLIKATAIYNELISECKE